MPISLDNIDKLSCDELKDNLISMYETKLKNSLEIDDNKLYEIFNLIKGDRVHTCRFIDITIRSFNSRNTVYSNALFDLKYNVPIIRSDASNQVITCTKYVLWKLKYDERVITYHTNGSFINLIYIKESEMFREVYINSKYSEALKTYKRFIELKGE